MLFAQDETSLADWGPFAITLVVTVVVILITHIVLRRSESADPADHSFRRQILSIVLALLGILIAILNLPDSIDSNLAFSAVGLIITGALAISSQSIIANAMAGLMLRSVSSFRPGDFIEVDESMGRVSEMGLFHTEIQSADRDLITIPNSLMMSRAVRVVRSSGTIVSASVSIGYDVSRHTLEDLFIEAAMSAKLEDPFVQVLELGDYSVSYRIAGFLADPRRLLATRSSLRGAILDTLSRAGIEILSPMYVARRQVSLAPVLPDDGEARRSWRRTAEDRVFDKAEAAAQLATARTDLADAIEALELLRTQPTDPDHTSEDIDAIVRRQEGRIDALERRIERLTEKHGAD